MAASSKIEKQTSKPSPPPVEEEHATIPMRVSPTVHQFIIAKAVWGESMDRTLRRLLKIKDGAKKGTNGK